MASLLVNKPKIAAPLDANFSPFILAKRALWKAAEDAKSDAKLSFVLEGANGLISPRHDIPCLPEDHANYKDCETYIERHIKFVVWQCGGLKLHLAGPEAMCKYLAGVWTPEGKYKFDLGVMFDIYSTKFAVEIHANANDLPTTTDAKLEVGADSSGNRLAFDLGKSDVKIVAVQDGEVKFSKEYEWDIWNKDPDTHYKVILDGLKEAATHLPKVDALGGSTAGVPINNECVWSDCFPDIETNLYKEKVVPIFKRLAKEFNDVPLKVINDGEVTALAAYQMIGADNVKKGVCGISMGSNEGFGYAWEDGNVTPWINELWAVPVDFGATETCFWSGDTGVGSMYFGQRAVEKLAKKDGWVFDEVDGKEMLPQHKLKVVQAKMKEGDAKARAIYETIGVYLGYATAQYADFFDFDHMIILGRVTSGDGGTIIFEKAQQVINECFPELSIKFGSPSEHMKRVGQAVAAAALPKIGN